MKKIKTKMPMYKQINNDTLILSQQAIYGSSRLGVLERDEIVSIDSSLHPQTPTIPDPLTENVTHWSRGHKRYELTNHLGNVLATVNDRKLPVYANNNFSYYKAEVMTANDYYAFGAQMPKRGFDTSDYRFSFNGFEKDNEVAGDDNHISWGDFGYDPRVVMRWSPDKLAAKYPWQSPYSSMGGNPILHRELDGNDYDVHVNHNAKTIIISASYIAMDEKAQTVVDNIVAFGKANNGRFEYKVKTGKNSYETYSIQFNLVDAKKNTDNPTMNTVQVRPDKEIAAIDNSSSESHPVGANIRSNLYVADSYQNDEDVASHEAGHGLGMEHKVTSTFGTNLMSKTVQEIAGESLNKHSIEDAIGRVGIGKQKSLTTENSESNLIGQPINVTSEGTAPINFNNGKVKEAESK